MQLLHMPLLLWESFQYAFAAFKLWRSIDFRQLQFCSFSKLISHKLVFFGWGEGTA